jgi:2-polyprenyl-3-methyl-5-hydroxy-6-metoxy-1,4-benzoquinol methylase
LLIRLARYKFVARMLRPRDSVLEIGSGSGVGTMFLSQHCARAIGIDVKQHEVNESRAINRRENVSFEVADFFEFPRERRFDAVVALDVIEHMPIEVGARLIEKAGQHLNPGGMVVIGTPSVYVREYQSALSKASHVKMYDQDELVELMERYFHRVLPFSMNDEVVHTGMPKMAWYYFMLALQPRDAA